MGNLLFLSSMEIFPLIVIIGLAFVVLALSKLFWMWLFGINEIISQLKESNKLLKLSLEEMRKTNAKSENPTT